MNKQAQNDAVALVEELEDVQDKYGITEEQLYLAATEESRKEYFLKMLKILKELTE